jgi:alcohol dehydrogenase class IV
MSHAVGETFRPAFEDRKVPYISYGLPFPEACSKHVEETLEAFRVYIIASKSLSANTDALKQLEDALGSNVVGTRIGMRPHTPWSDILSIVNEARPLNPDCIITLGAGSLTDGAKIVAWALANDVRNAEDLALLWAHGPTWANTSTERREPKPPEAPVISVPTSLSGGEYQSIAGGTDDKTNEKRLFEPPTKNPAIVVLDPELTTTTPEWVWLSTGIRAVDHCIETLCSLLSNRKGDAEAKKGLITLIPALLKCKHNPDDLEARLQCQMGVIPAMSAVGSGVPLGGKK